MERKFINNYGDQFNIFNLNVEFLDPDNKLKINDQYGHIYSIDVEDIFNRDPFHIIFEFTLLNERTNNFTVDIFFNHKKETSTTSLTINMHMTDSIVFIPNLNSNILLHSVFSWDILLDDKEGLYELGPDRDTQTFLCGISKTKSVNTKTYVLLKFTLGLFIVLFFLSLILLVTLIIKLVYFNKNDQEKYKKFDIDDE
jgi:hypothetical protein